MGKCKLLLLKKVFLDLSICWPGRLVGWQVAAQMTSHHFTAWRACWSIHPTVSWPQWWSSLWCWCWCRQHCPVAVVDVFGWVWQIPRRLWRNTESRCGIFDEPLSLILFGRFRCQGVAKIQMIHMCGIRFQWNALEMCQQIRSDSWMAILNENLIEEICNSCPHVRSQSRLGAFLKWLLWQGKQHTGINDVMSFLGCHHSHTL